MCTEDGLQYLSPAHSVEWLGRAPVNRLNTLSVWRKRALHSASPPVYGPAGSRVNICTVQLPLPCAHWAPWDVRSRPRYASPTSKCWVCSPSPSPSHVWIFWHDAGTQFYTVKLSIYTGLRIIINLNARILQHYVILTTSANNSKALRGLTGDAAIPGFYISQSSKSPLIPSIKLQAPLYGGLIPFCPLHSKACL